MTYRVAMAISGAVSLGSYEAGCVYELLNAFKEHNANPQNTPIEIDVLTGASAGGMTAAMIAQKLLYDKDALDGEESNVGYEAWSSTTVPRQPIDTNVFTIWLMPV